MRAAWTLLPVVAIAAAAPPKPAPVAPIGFNRDIRPILAESCFLCHGPDSAARKAGLRLDRREDALRVLAPGKPQASPLVARIFATGASQMPPTDSHKSLTPAQKELLRRWIAQGAPYEKHWSFQPLPARVPVPVVAGVANPIDAFVRARLAAEKLSPSKEASRWDWLRRVTLDLTGVAPSLAEADAFVADTRPDAYERVVDRLLASPRYGERMAAPWLDVARYADSYGYQSDQLSPTWPFRDWVVRAFNENKPYDRFVTEQLAGDLMPDASVETRLGTTFNRLHRMTNEGGSVAEEWRLEYVADRVRTFGTAFLGLTLECARCHDHKYDPITQRDFYRFSAFFDQIDESGLYNQSDIVPSPSLLLPTPAQTKELESARKGVNDAMIGLSKAGSSIYPRYKKWLDAAPAEPVIPDRIARYDFESLEGIAHADDVPLVEGKTGKAIQLTGDNNVNFPGLPFTRHTPFTIAFWLRDPRQLTEPMVLFQACDGTDAGFHGYDLMLENGTLTARMYRHWPGNAIAVHAMDPIPKDTWTHVAVTYDGSSRALGLRIFVNGKFARMEHLYDHLSKGIGTHTLTIGQRFRDRGFKGGQIDTLELFGRALEPIEVAQLADGVSMTRALEAAKRGPGIASGDLYFQYMNAVDPDVRTALAALAAARERIWRAEDPMLEVPAMETMRAVRFTYVLPRGRYDAPRTMANRVICGTPAALPGSGEKNRLGLARWLTSPDHPLTARVEVNRIWALLFGRGLVETVEDFGIQGRLPTHPELLDWLARDFVSSGWNVKALVRKIVLSRTYRQESAQRPDLRRRDPDNRLLARGPSGRLPAETIRDTALAASGLLDERLGGPPVSPYQPGDLWREANTMSPAYHQSVGGDLYRRSLYTIWKRTAPMPNMMAFDAVSREVCVARRPSTSTPLQAYVLLNDPQFVEAARALGEKTLKEGGADPAICVRYAFRRLATRPPTVTEQALLERLFIGQRDAFTKDPAAAKKLIAVGASQADPKLPPADLAAATVLAQAILNLDATLWKR